jgi:hypothetical protein
VRHTSSPVNPGLSGCENTIRLILLLTQPAVPAQLVVADKRLRMSRNLLPWPPMAQLEAHPQGCQFGAGSVGSRPDVLAAEATKAGSANMSPSLAVQRWRRERTSSPAGAQSYTCFLFQFHQPLMPTRCASHCPRGQ